LLFFIFAIFFGSCYIIILILAIVSASYNEERAKELAENEEKNLVNKRGKN
jgi:hypothetical protein